MDLVEIGWGGVDWIGLTQDRYKWRALVNALMNLRFHKLLGNYRVATQIVASLMLSSIEVVSGFPGQRNRERTYALCVGSC
jgi:hypothetical protein